MKTNTNMTEVTITFKNCPREIKTMFEVAFKKAPLCYIGEPLNIPDTGLSIDFEEVTDLEMQQNLIESVNTFIMANAFLALNRER